MVCVMGREYFNESVGSFIGICWAAHTARRAALLKKTIEVQRADGSPRAGTMSLRAGLGRLVLAPQRAY